MTGIFFHILLLFSLPFSLLSYEVIGIGNAAVDLLIQVDDAFLSDHVPGKKGGAEICDISTVTSLIELSRCIPKKTAGGSCVNTLRGLSNLGISCALYTHLGRDPIGQFFEDNLSKYNIAPLLDPFPDYATARILCMITPDGQRTQRGVFTVPTAPFSLTDKHLEKAKWMHLESYQLYCGDIAEKAMALAKKNHIKISLDLSSFETVLAFKDHLATLIPQYVDVLFANEDETGILTGFSSEKGCRKLLELCPLVVVTAGEKGCFVGHNKEMLYVPGFPAHVVDTTGAGDYFISGFLYGYLHELPLKDCARLGNRLGAWMTEVIGTELSDWPRVEGFLRENHMSF